MKKKKTKRVINWQKIFCFVSFIFILVCFLWYGGRFIYFYLDNKKTITTSETTNLGTTIINNNNNIKNINNSYYFTENADNNYLIYSNILWRIIKIDTNNKIYLISEDPLTSLSYGADINNYQDSYINKWLNKKEEDNTGILQNNLNNINKYLSNYNVCIDKIDSTDDIGCTKEYNNDYIGLLSIIDYVNTGGSNSFINNGKVTYLANSTTDNEVWYINSEGKLDTSDGDDIYGVKPVITINSNINSNAGDGTKNNPYKIETDNSLFGSYVKLDEDIYRIYEVEENNVKMILNNYITIDNEELSYSYSNNTYYHNDTIYGSLAYYLNNTYLNSLSYKDIISTDYYPNGYYDYDYDYTKILNTTIDTKVSLISIGNVIFNNDMNNFWTNTGTEEDGEKVYIVNEQGTLSSKSVTSKSYVVPCISINKDYLTKGNGTLESPYEME